MRDVDKLVDYLTRQLPMDLESFFTFFQRSYSLEKTSYTVTLAQFISIFIQFIEVSHLERKEGAVRKPFHRASESMSEETFKKYIFGEDFLLQQDLISEKLLQHTDRIR